MISKERLFLFGILALLSILFLVILRLNYYSIVFPVVFGILGMIVCIAIDWLSDYGLKADNAFEPGKSPIQKFCSCSPYKILTILFLIFFSLSLLSLFLGDYTKTVAYYLCVSLCAGILIIEILSCRMQIQGYGILLKTVLLSINIVFTNHLIYIHGISLPDLGFHFPVFIMSILNTGHVSSNTIGIYNIFSIHHIFASEIAIMTGYNPLSIYLLFGSFLIAIGVLFVFIIGKRFVNFQFGLVAALLFTCLDYYLMYGGHPEHQAYNYGIALICFTITLYTYRSNKPAFYILFVLTVVAITLTHHFSAAIVFVTAFSLLIVDIYQILQKRVFSLPSKFIVVTFSLLILVVICLVSSNNPVQYASSVFNPYFKDMYYLVTNLFVTPIPVTPIPVTPIPVTPIPVTPIPVTPIPVTPIPVTPIPVTPPSITPSIGYDKLPLITLFENTLGSSLLVLAAVLGFFAYIKKRSWFGDFTIVNGILLSILLGMGILSTTVFLLPDRLYPFLQIFCLVFLGAAGIIWLYNKVPLKKRSIIVGCICILVAMMSFFSLASIINGFETSLFVGNDVAYARLYTTSQDISSSEWCTSFIQNENRNILSLPINNKGMIDIDTVRDNSYFSFDRTLLKTGFVNWGIKFGQHSFVSADISLLQQLDIGSSYYDNGQIILMAKNGLV